MQTIRIDIVSDVVCPWCVIGYKRLQQAMAALSDQLRFEIEWHPFQLNPDMPPEGEPVSEHIRRKYGLSDEELAINRKRIEEIALGLGMSFYAGEDRRTYNTFDAHRVLHWARTEGKQTEMELALFDEYFLRGNNPSDARVLERATRSVGLPAGEVAKILSSARYAEAVQDELRHYQAAGIDAVPAFIINGKYLISGGQEPQTFVRVLREIAEGVE
jgi:predicted DsbA family dithiol-disulfide isomerase